MCLILIARQYHPDYPLVIAANRDEYFARPTRAAGFWPEAPQLLAGQDLSAGGTWLGITRQGRIAALTNVRDPFYPTPPEPISRGHLVSRFLTGKQSPGDYLQQLQGQHYEGFNLICGDTRNLLYLSNRQPGISPLAPGVHGLSNAALDTPWPKLVSGRLALADRLARHDTLTTEDLLPILNHRQQAPDEQLPHTGVEWERERILSARFIEGQSFDYGTRASTVLLLHRSGRVQFSEWSWDELGAPAGRVDTEFAIES